MRVDAVTAAAPRRYDVLDGMRGVAAVSVMIYHFSISGSYSVLPHASLAVDLFFMLSGFVICHSYGDRLKSGMSVSAYFGRRVIRLYPMFILGTLIGAPVLYLLISAGQATLSKGAFFGGLAYNLLLLPEIGNHLVHNMGSTVPMVGEIFPSDPPLWSLFFEIVASVLFPILILLRRNVLVGTIVAGFLVFCATVVASSAIHHTPLDFNPGWGADNFIGGFPRVIFEFSIGVFIYSLSRNSRFAAVFARAPSVIRNPYALYLVLIALFAWPKDLKGLYVVFVLVVAAPIMIMAGSQALAEGRIASKVAKFLGWISYPVYCLHFPIGRAVFLLSASWNYHQPVAAAASILLTIVIASALTKLYDEPVRSYLSRRAAARESTNAALLRPAT
jgi:peptidoglycan/LPS O-acetylase OafA/YrhL